MRVYRRIIPDEKPLPWLAFYMKESDKILDGTPLYKAEADYRRLRDEMEHKYKNYQEYLRSEQFQIVRKMAVTRCKGICEKCGIVAATHVHHLKYPPWGTYEKDASGVIALCHDCHYAIHEKEIRRKNEKTSSQSRV